MVDAKTPQPEHDEVEQYSSSKSSQEPDDSKLNILVSIPSSIEVKMVDATNLSDYEIWFSGSSALLSILVGFFVAYIQEDTAAVAKVLGAASLVFLALLIVCVVMTFVKRHAVRKKGKSIRLKTSNVVENK